MKLYTCWELEQYNSLREEVYAINFNDAMHEYIRNRGYRAEMETIYIPMAATNHETDCTIQYDVPLHPTCAPCLDGDYHVWIDEGRWKGVDHEVCQLCGLHRATQGDGIVTQKIIKYSMKGEKLPIKRKKAREVKPSAR